MSTILVGRQALITGASRGLGLEIARAYVREGASVLVCARDAEELDAARQQLAGERIDADQQVRARVADVSDSDSVRELVAEARTALPDLSILVSNAGVYGPKGSIWDVDWSEWVRAVEINLLGSVLVAREIAPHLRQRRGGKIIQLSGGGATSPLPGLSAYAASKAGVVRFVETLALELRDAGVDVNAIAPGALNTRMLDEVLEAGPERVGEAFYQRALEQQETGGVPLARGADLAVWLGSSASNGVTGKLLSAVWDPYREFDAHREDLASDVYTLRRIAPADRGMLWGG